MAISGMKHSESVEIAASPNEIFEAVRRLERMGEWSPENAGGEWTIGDGSSPGDTFLGTNRIGDREWQAPAEVTRSEPGVAFAFTVPSSENPMADWGYAFEAIDGGTRVTESWEVHRYPETWGADVPAEKVQARTQQVQEAMRATLHALKQSFEG